MTLLRTSVLAVALVTLPAGATEKAEKDAAAARPSAAHHDKNHSPRPKEAKARPEKKARPGARDTRADEKKAAKPCEEVKPCAIE